MRFYDEHLRTTLGKGAAGLLIGSATGAVVTLAGFLSAALAQAPTQTLSNILGGLILFLPIFIVWLIGAFTLGAGGWAILHTLRLRGGLSAMTWGGAITFIVVTGITGGRAMPLSALIGVAGTLAGLTTWKFSYRRPPSGNSEVLTQAPSGLSAINQEIEQRERAAPCGAALPVQSASDRTS